MESQEQSEVVFVKKDRERQYDQRNDLQWKNARINFYRNTLPNQLIKAKADDYWRKQIVQLFYKYQQIHEDSLKKFKKYKKQILSLKQIIENIEHQFAQKQIEVLPLTLIAKKGINNLKILHIQYSQKIIIRNFVCRYSISTYELFKIVHLNKLMNQVTIKGVELLQFDQFMAKKNYFDNFQIQHNQEELSWIKEFCPSKSLKLAIDIKVQFDVEKEKAQSHSANLVHFEQLFYSLSLGIKIRLGQWNKMKDWEKNLWKIYNIINKLEKIDLTICGQGPHYFISPQAIPFVRSTLFGGLTLFVNIAQISFQHINFSFLIPVNHLLAMKECLEIFFENNTITNLSQHKCHNFPIFPTITTIQSIYADLSVFRGQKCVLIQEILISNLSIKSLKCSNTNYSWTITQSLFNQLQDLIIYNCSPIFLGEFTCSPSNIKYLSLQHTNLGNDEEISQIFPKLFNLTYLLLGHINIRYQFFSLIPSPYLENIVIWANNAMIDRGLQQIDLKWPFLRYLTVCYCEKITENAWAACKFKGLIQLCVGSQMLTKGKRYLNEHKSKGIKIITY